MAGGLDFIHIKQVKRPRSRSRAVSYLIEGSWDHDSCC